MKTIITSPGRWKSHNMRLCRAIIVIFLLMFLGSAGLCDTPPDPYRQIIDRLEQLNGNHNVSVVRIGCSIKGRPIFAVMVEGRNKPDPNKDTRVRMLVLSGQHGNEPLPVYATLDLIESMERDAPDALDTVTVVFVPAVNPDGFAMGRRTNSAGADLNRDWLSPKQPETIAITQFIERFRPHILIDEHEWAKGDPYRPNCIETASFGHQANIRLARLLARNTESHLTVSGLKLQMTHYRQQSDQRMAHRRFAASGICSMLIETSPDWESDKRSQVYNEFVTSVLKCLSSPPDRVIANDLNVIKSKRPHAIAWAGSTDNANERKSAGLSPCWMAFLIVVVFILAKSAAPKKARRTIKQDPIHPSARTFCFSEAVQCDASVHARLEMMRRLRVRPTDRSQTTQKIA
jgi:hypothetical protein